MILTSSRRAFLTGAAGAAACATLATRVSAQAVSNAVADGFRVLRAQALAEAPRGRPSEGPLWAYEGAVPGPLLRVHQGDDVKIQLTNELATVTAIHWHGVRVPNAMDGVPYLSQQPAQPGTVFKYQFTAVDAGTFWYHAPSTFGQIERGLYGVLIVQ